MSLPVSQYYFMTVVVTLKKIGSGPRARGYPDDAYGTIFTMHHPWSYFKILHY